MALVSMQAMLGTARGSGSAVGAFNILEYNSMRAVVAAAEELRSPVILQTSPKTVEFWGAPTLAAWARQLAEPSAIPVALHLDHCRSLDLIRVCIRAGWTSVMIDASARPFEENLAMTRDVLALAEPAGVSVEAEMGEIAGVEDELSVAESRARLADPEKAAVFCSQVSLSAFAPAIGTAHGTYKGEPKLDFDRLAEIGRRVDVPLALHGGTGLPDEVVKRCIGLGCAKINISTALKHAFIDGFVEPHTERPKYDPLVLLASQFDRVKATVSDGIALFGSAGQAAGLK
jgi:fructose-bisphosphate aldolase class II/tagatose 1,6-diphosphate aldolase GatY/KbaY